MDKTLQTTAWQCLPREFREEVKETYEACIKMMDIRPSHSEIYANKLSTLEGIFGIHNLTSDAEGEDEMLMVSRKRVQELYKNYCTERDKEEKGTTNRLELSGRIAVLHALFGSKCLPDKVAHEDNFASKEPKPAEPKFKVGKKVMYKGVLRVIDLVDTVIHRYHLSNGNYYAEWVNESDLEPYTEPKNEGSATLCAESVRESRIASEETHLRNLSQKAANCVKHFDNIHKDSFAKERRLNIAAMAMQSILANSDEVYRAETCSMAKQTPKAIAEYALACADALIAEAKKGGNNGEGL